MNRTLALTVTVLAVTALAVLGVTVAAVGSPRAPVPVRAINTMPDLLAQDGFGNYQNSYSWSMGWFKGKLYVGTGRDEACVEDITVDYYLVVSDRYKMNPLPGVHCPRNPYDMDLRAQLWQYTPGTGRWRMVYRSPVEPNPRARGKSVARDIAYRGMVVYKGQLYIGDVTADEYIPGLKRRYPPRILATADGLHFRSLSARNVIERTPHGVSRPMGFRSMTVWRGHLYVTITPTLTGDGVVFEITKPWSSHPGFRQVSPPGLAVFEIQAFNGSLYLGTGDRTRGYGVYRMDPTFGHRHRSRPAYWSRVDVTYPPPRRPQPTYGFRPVVTNGAGRGAQITSVVSMHVYRHWLYVGASGWYNPQNTPSSELIRINPHGRWELVAGVARTVKGRVKAPISGLGDGFDNSFTAHFWRMATYNGALYIGTNDWSWLVQKAYAGLQPPYLAGIIQSALSGEFGFDLWASCNGHDFFPVTHDAFGNMYDFGARDLVPTRVGLFVGSANQAQGTKVWRLPVSPCQSLVHMAQPVSAAAMRQAPPNVGTPQAVLTDWQRAGTVVSWHASAGATRYRVMRAAETSISLNLAPPPVLPDGFTIADQLPDVVGPGTPGATAVQVTIPESFVPVATTDKTYFVDRARKRGERYLYQVTAIGASRAQSQPSAVAAAPDPRPAPTPEQIYQAIGSRAARALATARVADDQRDRTRTLAILAELQRSVGADSEAGLLIERLERRIRYADVAGGH